MKIYSKSNFVAGLIGLVVLVLYAVGVWEAHTGNWAIAIAFTANCLHTGLTKSRSERMKHLAAHYDETARMLHGRHHALKRNLPWILTVACFAAALVLRFLFQIWLPMWVCVIYLVALAVSAVYSIGLHKQITEYIDEHIPQEEAEDEPK